MNWCFNMIYKYNHCIINRKVRGREIWNLVVGGFDSNVFICLVMQIISFLFSFLWFIIVWMMISHAHNSSTMSITSVHISHHHGSQHPALSNLFLDSSTPYLTLRCVWPFDTTLLCFFKSHKWERLFWIIFIEHLSVRHYSLWFTLLSHLLLRAIKQPAQVCCLCETRVRMTLSQKLKCTTQFIGPNRIEVYFLKGIRLKCQVVKVIREGKTNEMKKGWDSGDGGRMLRKSHAPKSLRKSKVSINEKLRIGKDYLKKKTLITKWALWH